MAVIDQKYKVFIWLYIFTDFWILLWKHREKKTENDENEEAENETEIKHLKV